MSWLGSTAHLSAFPLHLTQRLLSGYLAGSPAPAWLRLSSCLLVMFPVQRGSCPTGNQRMRVPSYPPSYSAIHLPSLHPSIHQQVHPSKYMCVCKSIHPHRHIIQPSINLSFYPHIHSLIQPSSIQPSICTYSYSSLYPPIYHPFIH